MASPKAIAARRIFIDHPSQVVPHPDATSGAFSATSSAAIPMPISSGVRRREPSFRHALPRTMGYSTDLAFRQARGSADAGLPGPPTDRMIARPPTSGPARREPACSLDPGPAGARSLRPHRQRLAGRRGAAPDAQRRLAPVAFPRAGPRLRPPEARRQGRQPDAARQALRGRCPQRPCCCSATPPSNTATRASAAPSRSAVRRASRRSGFAPTWPSSSCCTRTCCCGIVTPPDSTTSAIPDVDAFIAYGDGHWPRCVGRAAQRSRVHAAVQPGAPERDRRSRRARRSLPHAAAAPQRSRGLDPLVRGRRRRAAASGARASSSPT